MTQRIIKFRAWDKDSKEMIDAKSIGDQSWNVLTSAMYGKGDWEFMQFTGLLDKNGKEIFEGDVVQVKTWTAKEGSIFKKGQVCWVKDNVFVAVHNDPMSPYSTRYPNPPEVSWEIIGNIYENPDLLSKEQR